MVAIGHLGHAMLKVSEGTIKSVSKGRKGEK